MADGYTLTFNHSLSAFHVSLIIVNRIPIIIFPIRICPLFGKINITKDDVIRILAIFISGACNIGIATFGCIIGKDVSFILVNRYTFRSCIISKITFVTITCKSIYIITFWLSYFLPESYQSNLCLLQLHLLQQMPLRKHWQYCLSQLPSYRLTPESYCSHIHNAL